MFSLFEGRKAKTKKRIIKALDVYIPGIDGLDPEEIGMMLDKAQFIKESSLMLLDENDPAKAYWEDPMMIEESKALDRIDFWFKWMIGWSAEGAEGNAKLLLLVFIFILLVLQFILNFELEVSKCGKHYQEALNTVGLLIQRKIFQ
jgi:hypothetical protein